QLPRAPRPPGPSDPLWLPPQPPLREQQGWCRPLRSGEEAMEGVACRRGRVPSRGADARENRLRRAIGDVSANYESFTAFWLSAGLPPSGCITVRDKRGADNTYITTPRARATWKAGGCARMEASRNRSRL